MPNPAKSRFADDQLLEVIPQSRSFRQALALLGLNESGANYNNLKRRIQALQVDTSHFVGKAHLRGRLPANAKPLAEIFNVRSPRRRSSFKKRLLDAGVLENKCLGCLGEPIWQGKPLVLELDHINGDRFDNRPENLRLVCPNCHSQTPNFRGRKNKLVQVV